MENDLFAESAHYSFASVAFHCSCNPATCHHDGPFGFSNIIGLMNATAFSKPS